MFSILKGIWISFKPIKHYVHFFRQKKGGLAVIFAILLPFIFSCCALVFDGSRLLMKRARLADALNEAALVVATSNYSAPGSIDQIKLKALLNNYVNVYLPNETITSSDVIISNITVHDDDTNADYQLPVFNLKAKVDVKTILPIDIVPAFSEKVELANQGKVRKGLQLDLGEPTDFVLVLDFSGSMLDPSAEPGMSRINLLKKVVKDMTEKALDAYSASTFAIVPFEIGVPVKLQLTDNKTGLRYPASNELGGDIPGCSVLMVPNKIAHSTLKNPNNSAEKMKIGFDIDYAFWANKTLRIKNLPKPTNSASTLPYPIDNVNTILDWGRYSYFKDIVMPSLSHQLGRAATWDDLISRGWCKYAISSIANVSHPFTCEKPPIAPLIDLNTSIFSTNNQLIIAEEIEAARTVFSYGGGTYGTINNLNAMDVNSTLAGMFDEANIINFPRNYGTYADSTTIDSSNPFAHMCLSSGHDYIIFQNGSRDKLAFIKQNTFLIEPTSDINVLNQFQSMNANGGTDSVSGLLRAVPELLKGPNKRKAMIVISDGDDNNTSLTDAVHKNRSSGQRVCDLIRKGVKDRNANITDVDIYFISVVNDASGRARTKYWADYCTGPDNAVVATNYDAIMKKFTEIMNKYEETGYFEN